MRVARPQDLTFVKNTISFRVKICSGLKIQKVHDVGGSCSGPQSSGHRLGEFSKSHPSIEDEPKLRYTQKGCRDNRRLDDGTAGASSRGHAQALGECLPYRTSASISSVTERTSDSENNRTTVMMCESEARPLLLCTSVGADGSGRADDEHACESEAQPLLLCTFPGADGYGSADDEHERT